MNRTENQKRKVTQAAVERCSVFCYRFLKGKELVFKLADRAGFLESKTLGGLLQAANHGGRTAEKHLDVVGGLGEPFLNDLLAN